MTYILALETALDVCSVALGKGGVLVADKSVSGTNLHASHLTVFIEDVLQAAGITYKDLNAVCLSEGPGSYTGLRIGTSAAKGLCFALEIPLIGVNTLQSMAFGAYKIHPEINENSVFCPMIDARRMEVYYALYNNNLQEIQPTKAAIVTDEEFAGILAEKEVIFFGNGMPKSREILSKFPKAFFLDDIYARAENLLPLAFDKFYAQQTENLYNFEPFYLKEFVAGSPAEKVKKLLNP
jgi:tRNA threonylcarbamoyladenosine biosynthesis protein TsaB